MQKGHPPHQTTTADDLPTLGGNKTISPIARDIPTSMSSATDTTPRGGGCRR